MDKKMDDKYKKHLLSLHLPKFIWICQVYNGQNEYLNENCLGIVIIDTTNLATILFCCIKDKLFFFMPKIENVYSKNETIHFQMDSYKHNLKGGWNKWQS